MTACPIIPAVGASRAFSLLELLISIAVIAALLGTLLPVLSHARAAGYRAVCASSLRQIGHAWQAYVQDNQDHFPKALDNPQWLYGGLRFLGNDGLAIVDTSRPVNAYLSFASTSSGSVTRNAEAAKIFHCPADSGVWRLAATERRGVPAPSILGPNGGQTCLRFYGNSYRANPYLLDSTLAGIDQQSRAIALHEVLNDTSRVLVAGDPVWAYVAAPYLDIRESPGSALDASWHASPASGNALAIDGSIRFLDYAAAKGTTPLFTLRPRP